MLSYLPHKSLPNSHTVNHAPFHFPHNSTGNIFHAQVFHNSYSFVPFSLLPTSISWVYPPEVSVGRRANPALACIPGRGCTLARFTRSDAPGSPAPVKVNKYFILWNPGSRKDQAPPPLSATSRPASVLNTGKAAAAPSAFAVVCIISRVCVHPW